ncbi:SixA phosphatase family protein [Mucilaginibacter myungsuensis]|uniref:Histidine phosphatase family protein n=1 Tax=Mucilaginibacter myungsuensis TaxID=649104 RepID=A0A929PWU1_9SPHI|nr:histidine phosphatase family protein [Mucilaginibacter myungsuensis]MBE9662451.1 histidine phosphatase family protein [Mucilaginibacter myungsuensis]MDN3597871.1 histidine phosphatase family protein [Mucilaginibacter myungsuensis]
MKKLMLIRHAKAGSHDINDFDRPLTESGKEDAAYMGDALKQAQLLPELFVISPSLRTKTTAQIIAGILEVTRFTEDKTIYEANTHALLRVINKLSDDNSFVALVGHNPGISQILYELSGEPRDMSPGDIALIGFDFDEWEMVHSDTGKLAWYGSPKGR